ncbi:hypothetical protein CICLE_v10023248mg [Citrus x clementina]|uniref:Uncharacterized protein n=1 Tax=Citrus clementina TaxID=85681 RepID=V4TWV7_CITCL|nr:hypothetical protein CICLE_v10023248mg [Citrus x clementina]
MGHGRRLIRGAGGLITCSLSSGFTKAMETVVRFNYFLQVKGGGWNHTVIMNSSQGSEQLTNRTRS